MTLHEVLCEHLAGLQSRRFPAGADDPKSAPLEFINDAFGERRFRPDHGQVNLLALRKIRERANVRRTNCNALSNFGDPCVAGCTNDFRGPAARLFKSPNQRVLAPA